MLRNTLHIAAGLVLALAMFVPIARADERDQASQLTFDRPVAIPGMVLPAGTYWFTVVPDSANGQIVQIFNADRSKLIATRLAIATERNEVSDHTEMRFVEQPKNELRLVGWFYPDRLIGHEFVYQWAPGKRYV